jgi:hypothetical protein
MTDDEAPRLPAGLCQTDGAVAGDCVEWNFPEPATCALCGAELEAAQMATSEEIAAASRSFETEQADRSISA